MSNYSTGYAVSQTGNLYTLQSNNTPAGLSQYHGANGTNINAPLNYRKLVGFRGLDNDFFFYIKNQNRKPIYIANLTIYANIVHRETHARMVTKVCQIMDGEQGLCRLTLNSNDLAQVDAGMYDLILTYKDDRGLTLPLYADTNMRINLIIEVSDAGHSIPLTSETTTTFLSNGSGHMVGERIHGPYYYGRTKGLITFTAETTNYTGHLFLQGSIQSHPDENDWFNIELGAIVDYHPFFNHTGIEPFTCTATVKHLRVAWQETGQGTVDKVVFRL
jgi:hypothetical protein